MARNNYFNKGDPYSEWHRSLDNKLGYIDIDSVGICLKCKAPLYLAETTFDVNQTWKATTTTEALARLAGLPSFLIFYKVDKKEVMLTPEAWVQAMELLQDRHNLVCRRKDVA